MGKINILTPDVFNRIAAGEVVDRPYSVVKELVENAIDAGAGEIEIRIERGGKSYISVADNGSGIDYSDLKSVFLPHATSKIAKASDLENIVTLGFRGEAVASISAVSHMKYTSKCADGECYAVECNGGAIGEVQRAAGDNGTLVEVSDLFYNTPVRLKFLKSDKAEESEISVFVNRFILSHPNISFRYYIDGRLAAQSLGEGHKEALVSVYGAGILENTYPIDAVKHGVRIRGYISNQNYFKPNRNYQSVFLNGRYIVNATVSAALSNAYANYAMKRQYPFYVLYIDVPTEIVDVNVHPNKADVRFADNQIVYGCIYSVISAVLDGTSGALNYVVDPKGSPRGEKAAPVPFSAESVKAGAGKKETFGSSSVPVFTYEQAKREVMMAKPQDDARKAESFAGALPFEEAEKRTPTAKAKKKKGEETPFSDLYFKENDLSLGKDAFEENKRLLLEMEEKKRQARLDVDNCVFKGNLFNTYLIYELADDVYLIDQHAAHERLIYDKLKRKIETRTVVKQPMLLPYAMHVSPVEDCFLHDYLPYLQEMGFDIEETGCDDYTVSAVPLDLQDIALDAFFADILSDTSGIREIKLVDLLKDKLATCACKAAIKGGMSLTEEEVKALLKEMNGNTGLKCPHGRPAVVKLSKVEIEKMFKRIV